MKTQLIDYISSKRALIYINDYDYREIDNFIQNGLKDIKNVEIHEYRAFGEVDFKSKKISTTPVNLMGFLQAYMINGTDKNVVLLLKDVDKELENPEVIAMLKKIAEMNIAHPKYNCMVTIVSQNIQVPRDLESYITILEIPKLTKNEIEKYIKEVAKERNMKIDEEDLGEIAISLKGLSKWCITQIINGMETVSSSAINGIIKEKGQIIKKSGILELINFKERAQDIGGLQNMKDWLNRKAQIFRRLDEANRFGVDTPKGMLIVGMPGCGKSLTAKAASRMFNVPLLRLDIGRLLGKYVGESEYNLRMALKTAESISPCILWIDEIEKAFAGIDQTGGASDITKRLFGHFLTWLQEKENTVFVVATANDITPFPPEFLRKGRFDEIFYVDFPTHQERQEIFRIHLEKRGKYNETIVDLSKLATEAEDFCGADIEEVVKIAVENSFLDKQQANITTEDIVQIIKETDPLKKILFEKIKALKKAYEKFKLRPASSRENGNPELDNRNMVLVTGGKYTPSFFEEEREVKDLWVSKYETTQDQWSELMGTDPSKFKGARRPVECVSWIDALKFCNKLSEKNGLKPAYKIEKDILQKVIYYDGEEVYPDIADFSKVEGYRLPTHLEWEWFARGGEIAIQEGTFDLQYSGSDTPEQVSWFKTNSGGQTHAVGTKKPNQLGLYDCSGNIYEWIYDTNTEGYLDEERPYIYDESSDSRKRLGGSWDSETFLISTVGSCIVNKTYTGVGFRVVRTA